MAYIDNHLGRSSDEQAEESAVLSEPAIVNSVFITGGSIELTDFGVRLIGWEALPEMNERRIMTRLVMSETTARHFAARLREMLMRGGH